MQLLLTIFNGKANSEDPDQTAPDLGLHSFHISFYWQLWCMNFRTFTISGIELFCIRGLKCYFCHLESAASCPF